MNRKERRRDVARRRNVKLPSTDIPQIDIPVLADRVGISAKIPYENLQGKSLFVATPMYGGMCTGIYTRCMLNLVEICKEIGVQLSVHYLFNESLIQRGRNYCCDEFMRARVGPPPPEGEPDARPYFSHMLFIDSDIGFDPKDVLFMLALADPGTDKDVICAPYPKKCIAWEKIKVAVNRGFAEKDANVLERFVGDYVFNPKNASGIKLNEPSEILEGGTGFMMIQRQAFEKFRAAFPNQHYRPDHVRTKHFDGSRPIMAYFDCVIDRGYTFDDLHELMLKAAKGEAVQDQFAELLNREKSASMRYLSEDYMFCQYLSKAGGHVWLLPWIKLTHTGTYIFGGSLLDLAQLGVTPTADPNELKNKK